MLRKEPRRVAYYARIPDSSSFRYRCYSMSQAINDRVEGVSSSWFCEADGIRLLEVAREVECLVVCRSKYTAKLAQMITVARSAGARVLFDCDDLVFDLKYVTHLVQALDQMETRPAQMERFWDFWFASFARVRAALELCDGLIVTNRYLADRAAESLDMPIHVIGNFMSTEQVQFSREVAAARAAAGDRRDGYIDIGYFSGSATHNKDFAIAGAAVARAMDRHPQLRVRVAGHLAADHPDLVRQADRVETLPFTDFLTLQSTIAATEINIAPLQDLVFTNCKSALKYFDAAAVGVPTVASPTFAMASAIQDGHTGLLAGSDEWDEVLERIICDYDGFGRDLGRAAFADAHTHHTAAPHVPEIRAALGV